MLRRKLNLPNTSTTADEVLDDTSDYSTAETVAKKIKINTNNDQQTSKYFNNLNEGLFLPVNVALLNIAKQLNEHLQNLTFRSPIEYVYNPVEYAFNLHEQYINTYCKSTKEIIFVGMNPGPFGMCQTGVPFGDINHVKNWLGIDGMLLSKPRNECPNRPILGLSCTRQEISGQKFWGLFEKICGTPENFFKSAFVYNYCPLAFMKNNGANVTPNVIKSDIRKLLEESCDQALFEVIQALQPKYVIGVGTYAKDRCQRVVQKNALNARVIYLKHPSPIIPNNNNWPETTEKFLLDEGLLYLFK